MTKNRTRTPVYLDPGIHPGLEVKVLIPVDDVDMEYYQLKHHDFCELTCVITSQIK